MTATDKLALRWQFESFTKEFQDECWKQMLDEFAAAWKFKRNRYWLKRTIERFAVARPDLPLFLSARGQMADFDEPAAVWKQYAPVPKPDVYIGPERYLAM